MNRAPSPSHLLRSTFHSAPVARSTPAHSTRNFLVKSARFGNSAQLCVRLHMTTIAGSRDLTTPVVTAELKHPSVE